MFGFFTKKKNVSTIQPKEIDTNLDLDLMKKRAFSMWYGDFHRKFGGKPPENLSAWYDEVLKSKKELRVFLNGSNYSINHHGFVVNLSVEPQAFMRIGSYGVDDVSCFRQGNPNEKKRYTFAYQSRTFVLTIKDPKNNVYVCRCLGFFSSDSKVINLFGSFYDFPMSKFILDSCLHALAKTMLNTRVIVQRCEEINIAGAGLYTHGPYWSFYEAGQGYKFEKQSLFAVEKSFISGETNG